MKKGFFLALTLLYASLSFAMKPEYGFAMMISDNFDGKKTVSGATYKKGELTGSHMSLPFGTHVRVTHLGSGKNVVIRIIDKGPFVAGHVVGLSRAAATRLGIESEGKARVKVEIIDPNDPDGNKKRQRETLSQKNESLNVVKEAGQMQVGGLYKMQVLKLEPKGFGVQVATFTDYDGVVSQLAVLQKNWYKGAMVFVDEKAGKAQYKIILGPFFTKEEAESYRKNFKKKEKVDAFVVNLEELAQ